MNSWLIDVWRRRRRRGKPILVWAGAGGADRGLLAGLRRPWAASWTEPVIRLVKGDFVPLAKRPDAAPLTMRCRFLEKADCGRQGAGGSSRQGAGSWRGNCRQAIEDTLQAWSGGSKPGAPRGGPEGGRNGRARRPSTKAHAAMGPPPGTLIVPSTTASSSTPGEITATPCPDSPGPARQKVVGSDQATALWLQPASDYMWITQAEAQR